MTTEASHKTRMLWLSGVLHAFTHLYQVALLPLYLLIQKDFKLESVSQATLLLTVVMVAYYAPSYPMGVLADQLNRKKLLGYGLAVNGLGFVGLALAPSYSWALAAAAVAGFGGSTYHPSATAMVARLFPASTGKALGLTGIGASLGFFAGPLYAGWRAGALEPALGAAAWRRPILELGLLGMAAAGVFAWLAPSDKPVVSNERKSLRAPKIFPTPALWVFFILCAIAFSVRDFAGTSMASLGSLFLQNAHGYGPKWTGLTLSGIFLASAISNPIFGRLSDRGRLRWVALALLVAAAMIAIFPHTPAHWAIPTFVVYGFFFLASYPMTEAAVMEAVPDEVRGRVFGLFITAGGLIGNFSHWAMGAQVKALGAAAYTVNGYFLIYTMLAGLMVLSLAGLPCLNAIRKREEQVEPKTPSREYANERAPLPLLRKAYGGQAIPRGKGETPPP